MKQLSGILYTSIIVLSMLLSLNSCEDNNSIDKNRSVIVLNERPVTKFDEWLNAMYLKPYNIAVKYRFEDLQSDFAYNLVPADRAKSIQLANLVKFMCIEPYDDVTGSKQFIRSLFPKELQIIGSAGINANGTELLGVAEGGRKIVLYKANFMDVKDIVNLNDQYFHTVHHEFTHIQNQTKPYPDEFKQISGADYVSGAWSDANTYSTPSNIKDIIIKEYETPTTKELTDEILPRLNVLKAKLEKNERLTADENKEFNMLNERLTNILSDDQKRLEINRFQDILTVMSSLTISEVNALRKGFISPYSSMNDIEDFAELQAFYITDTPKIWNTKLLIAGEDAANIIMKKMNIVKTYLSSEWKVDIDALRDNVQRRTIEVKNIDVNSLSIEKQ